MLTQERAKQLLQYDPETGKLYWKESRGSVAAGTELKASHSLGYVRARIDGELYYGHRLIFFMETGEWPDEVDHMYGDTSDNRWDKIRPSTHKQNLTSTKLRKDNTSGYKGVSWNKNMKKYVAQAKVNGKQTYFGLYDTAEEASKVIIKVRNEFFGDFARHD